MKKSGYIMHKVQVYSPSFDPIVLQHAFEERVYGATLNFPEGGFIACGVPIGHEDFQRQEWDKILERTEARMDNIVNGAIKGKTRTQAQLMDYCCKEQMYYWFRTMDIGDDPVMLARLRLFDTLPMGNARRSIDGWSRLAPSKIIRARG